MKAERTRPRRANLCRLTGIVAVLSGLLLAGCKGIPTQSERNARGNLENVRNSFRPEDHPAALPRLDTNATLETLVTFAMLNQPQVAAAYYDYAAAVERITLERSLPDPRLTLELDIQDVVATVMPGLMAEVPWTKKLRIRADVASADSQAKYFAFQSAVLQTAYAVKRAYYPLHFLKDRLRIAQETLTLLGEVEQIARARAEAGKVTLQDVLRAQIEEERLKTEIANLEDSRNPFMTQLKAAMGLSAKDAEPPIPGGFEPSPLDLDSDRVLAIALERNPGLKQMEAEVRAAEAGIQLAHQSKRPDFSLGVEADVKASPVLWRPKLGVTLPIWRDKIAAEIASAQAAKSAAQSRLNAGQIQLAVELADKSFMYREATRSLALLSDALLPKAQLSLEVARGAYSTGRNEFIDLLEAERALLDFRMAQVEARIRRELALAEISLLIAGNLPAGAPILGSEHVPNEQGRKTRK